MARAHVNVAGSPKIWTWLTVVDIEQPWELLMGGKLLKKLDIQLMTPAMRRQMVKRGLPPSESSESKESEHPAGSEAINMPTDADYEEIVSSSAALNIVTDTKPIEMCTDAEAGSQPSVSVLQPQRLCAKLGLQGNFFKEQCDEDFHLWDSRYPPASQTSVEQRIVHQIEGAEQAKKLIDVLMTKGASSLHEYPSGCPPPAAIVPISPPLSDHAKLVFTLQHPMSEAAHQA
ncbi:hypothetical protein H4S06_000183 [Coemansia sp. BCRC 34490]|nr:hypothetical protein H4S06_000183 [Coemansia sp. BCRC 34490]